MVYPHWLEDIEGDEVPKLIGSDAITIRTIAGPGSGKTLGLVRRVERIMHPDGLNAGANDVIVVAFNRVIAAQLRVDIKKRLADIADAQVPIIQTVHALCSAILEYSLRLLLPHEVEFMMYDVLSQHPDIAKIYKRPNTHTINNVTQALRQHEAHVEDHPLLWSAVQEWLERHRARLISEVPQILLDRIHGGDFDHQVYDHVIVDEFQDLTLAEQELVFRLRRPGGSLVALGDPRQSIYAFRGNDPGGLSRIEDLLDDGDTVEDIPITECRRCPERIVDAANRLMTLSGVQAMRAANKGEADIHVVTWQSFQAEAIGMARAIAANLKAHPDDRHMIMVTRRLFGYMLRDAMKTVDESISVALDFSEGLLEYWAAREAFILFMLLVDPDPPSWRAWLGYQNSDTGKDYKPVERNSGAYLRLLSESEDVITDERIDTLLDEKRTKSRGKGGVTLWDRASRYRELRERFLAGADSAEHVVAAVFDPANWIDEAYDSDEAMGATADLATLRQHALTTLKDLQERKPSASKEQLLPEVARQLRHAIATREDVETDESSDLHVSTLWGAKGVTAEHVYILGACNEALPGARRPEYPGTDVQYREEQRRLFYVSITRARRTLVISRALYCNVGAARQIGLSVPHDAKSPYKLQMSSFHRDITKLLPRAVNGDMWGGLVDGSTA